MGLLQIVTVLKNVSLKALPLLFVPAHGCWLQAGAIKEFAGHLESILEASAHPASNAIQGLAASVNSGEVRIQHFRILPDGSRVLMDGMAMDQAATLQKTQADLTAALNALKKADQDNAGLKDLNATLEAELDTGRTQSADALKRQADRIAELEESLKVVLSTPAASAIPAPQGLTVPDQGGTEATLPAPASHKKKTKAAKPAEPAPPHGEEVDLGATGIQT
jgi:hypothetical protein